MAEHRRNVGTILQNLETKNVKYLCCVWEYCFSHMMKIQ